MLKENQEVASKTRRQWVKAGVFAGLSGFALAVRPAPAQELIITDKKGLIEGSIVVGPDKIAGYRAYPEGAKNAPVVVVVQEIFGVHEHLRDICRRFAKQGYYAISVEYFQRQGDPKSIADIAEIMKSIVSKVPDEQVFSDTDAAFEFAVKEGASASRHAITGFCWGGRIVWLYAAHSKAIKAGVAWYGRLIDKNEKPNPLQPIYPLEVVEKLQAPVLGIYGGKDIGIPLTDVEKMENELRINNKNSMIQVYPDAQHGFFADYRGSYHNESAEDAWDKALAWFKQHGV